jgi:hypothetical protein
MMRVGLVLTAALTVACVSLPDPAELTRRPTDVILLDGEWSGDFASIDGTSRGTLELTLGVRDDIARGQAVIAPMTYPDVGVSAPARPQERPTRRTLVSFVSITDGVVTGTLPPYFDADIGGLVQMTLVGRLRSWNVIEGSFVVLGPSLTVVQAGTWRVVRG